MTLDKFDKSILNLLQQDGRLTNQDLADKIGLSPSACLRRLKALEDSQLIEGYRALVNAKALGLTLMAIISISMDKHTQQRFDAFNQAIQNLPNVLECLLITGQTADYQLKVLVKDLEDYQHLLLKHITQIEGVSGVHTSFVLQKIVYNTGIYIE